jgi:diaminopimelate decarboxylase
MRNHLRLSENAEIVIRKHIALADDPFYLYDTSLIRSVCRKFRSLPYPETKIHFATMANAHPAFLRIVREEGLCAFVNSLMHLETAMASGFSGEEIIFTASAMNEQTMKRLHAGEFLVNLDSLCQIEQWRKLFPRASYGIRCNIGDLADARQANCGYFIGKESRLGLTPDEIGSLAGDPQVNGLHLYAGTDIPSVDYFRSCYQALTEFAHYFPALTYVDFGGGFGLEGEGAEEFDFHAYGLMTQEVMKRLNVTRGRQLRMIIEPGRIIGRKAGWYVCRITDIKFRGGKQLIGVNGSVAQFPRPLFYPETAKHPVMLLHVQTTTNGTPDVLSSICGCSTYSRDFLARDILLPPAHTGDIIVIGDAGSYCASAYTHFLGFPVAKEIFYDGDRCLERKTSGAILQFSR